MLKYLVRQKLLELERLVKEKIDKAEKTTRRMDKEAATLGHAAAGSWSVGAERNFAEGQAAISAGNLHNLKSLLHDIEKSKNEASDSILPVSWVELTENGKPLSFFFTNQPTSLEEFKLVTANSPLGQVLKGKKVGEKVKFNGKIIKITTVE